MTQKTRDSPLKLPERRVAVICLGNSITLKLLKIVTFLDLDWVEDDELSAIKSCSSVMFSQHLSLLNGGPKVWCTQLTVQKLQLPFANNPFNFRVLV